MNILWICTDQQRYDTLGCTGNPFVHTPNLDRLAEEGMLVTRAYSQSPVCAPSRGSFLTGRYPRTSGPRQNGQDIDPKERLLPRILKDHGYFCGLSGKLHLSACHDKTGRLTEPRIDDGYDFFSWSHHPQPVHGTNWPANAYNQWLIREGVEYKTTERADCRYVKTGMPEEYHQTTWCVNEALAFMETARQYGKDWMFSINFFDPHHDFDPPEAYFKPYLEDLDRLPLPEYKEGELDTKPIFQQKDHGGAYDNQGGYPYPAMTDHDHRMVKAAYYAMIDLIDRQVGRLLDYLKESGQEQDTLVVFHSDHGETLGDHGIYLKGPYMYECNVHVPLILRLPGVIPAGMRRDALVGLVDLAPTFLDLLSLPAEPGMQGRSFKPLLTDADAADCFRTSVYAEYYNANIAHRDPKAFLTMAVAKHYKLIRVHKRPGDPGVNGELYDLQERPLEQVNHYDDPAYAEVKTEMLECLADLMAETIDPLPLRKADW